MLIARKAIVLYAPSVKDGGPEVKITLIWYPAGLECAQWTAQQGSGQKVMASQLRILTWVREHVMLEPKEFTELDDLMQEISGQPTMGPTNGDRHVPMTNEVRSAIDPKRV